MKILVDTKELRIGNLLETHDLVTTYIYDKFVKVTGIGKKTIKIECFPFPQKKLPEILRVYGADINYYWLSRLRFEQSEKHPWSFRKELPSNKDYYLVVLLHDKEILIKIIHFSQFVDDSSGPDQWTILDEDEEDDKKEKTIPSFDTWHIKYVHELQNLYYTLTGEELYVPTGIEDVYERIDGSSINELIRIYKGLEKEYGVTDPNQLKEIKNSISQRVNQLLNDENMPFTDNWMDL